MKVYAIILFSLLTGCIVAESGEPPIDLSPVDVGGTVAPETTLEDEQGTTVETDGQDAGQAPQQDVEPEVTFDEQSMPPMPSYPGGPHSLELWKVMPDMKFYQPWRDEWVELSEFYLHEEYRAILVVSSAGWCGPCLMEAASLVEIYDKYHKDGLEIVYTLGNTNLPGDVPFDEYEYWEDDMFFMEMWESMASQEANKMVNYQMYADPEREFIKYLPNHAWPLSLLVTTKDMGIRLVEEGYWSVLMENKIKMVLYNEVPTIPFN